MRALSSPLPPLFLRLALIYPLEIGIYLGVALYKIKITKSAFIMVQPQTQPIKLRDTPMSTRCKFTSAGRKVFMLKYYTNMVNEVNAL